MGGSEERLGRPPYAEFGREIGFSDLPEPCRELVLERYRRLWDLPEPDPEVG